MMEIQQLHLVLLLYQIYLEVRQLIHREALQQIQPMLLLMEHQIYTVSSLSLADGTGAASNYTLSGGTYSATVTQKVLGTFRK